MLAPIRKPSGDSDLGRAVWELIDRVNALQQLPSGGPMMQLTGGVLMPQVASLIGAGSSISLYRVHEIKRDWLVCHKATLNADYTWEVSNEDEIVAKPFDFQYSLWAGKSVGGYTWRTLDNDTSLLVPLQTNTRDMDCATRQLTIDYQALAVVSRTSSAAHTEITLNQEIWPPYVIDKTVIAVAAVSADVLNVPEETFGEGEDAETVDAITSKLIDLNVGGRSWCDRRYELEFCFDGERKTCLIRTSEPAVIE